jgi:hypothetical protein
MQFIISTPTKLTPSLILEVMAAFVSQFFPFFWFVTFAKSAF